MADRYCSKCRRTMNDINFYTLKSGEKSDLCKSCETMHIDNYDPETFKWLLERYDVPYIEGEWNVLRDRAYQKNPLKMTGMSVFGKYLSKMKLKQWREFGYADSERLAVEAEEKARMAGINKTTIEERAANIKAAYENGEISEAQYQTFVETEGPKESDIIAQGAPIKMSGGGGGFYPVNDNPFEKVDLPDVDLTEEDKIYLAQKWGRLYTKEDWVSLESLWEGYNKSFDLHNADLINGTKQLCKLELKGNQALDSGDIESYSKIARASDSLRKSLKFTEAQRKEERAEEFSAYGLIVAFAEKNSTESHIRPLDLTVDRDMVDKDIRDIKKYNQELIKEDPAVYKMIEQYIKKREHLAEQEEDAANSEDGIHQLSDKELKEYTDYVDGQREQDKILEEGEKN